MMQTAIESAVGVEVADIVPLSGGCIGRVYRVSFISGEELVAKFDERPSTTLAVEALMLRYLETHSQLPVPAVIFSSDTLLLMEFQPGESHFTDLAEEHAAELLAELHSLSAPAFGFEQGTLIGGLRQPNPWTSSWLEFFREQRLLYMATEAHIAGRLSQDVFHRLQEFCSRLDKWLIEPEHPSLIHGDVWTTNVLAEGNRITAFVDPAVYYAQAEIELAFITLFDTFGEPFFRKYHELRPMLPGFFEERRNIYNLYPLLVHVRLFGGSYEHSVNRILHQFGF